MFIGSMKILTPIDFQSIATAKAEYGLVAYGGKIVTGRIWDATIRPVVRITTEYGWDIVCSPEQVFMLDEGVGMCTAAELKGKRLRRDMRAFGDRRSVLITNVKDGGEEPVYRFSVPKGEWGIVEGFVVRGIE